jgi:phosphoglycerate dehydrogenase-like enzyme
VYEHATPIAEYVLGALVVLTAKLVRRDRLLRQGVWEGTARGEGEPHEELAGRTLGLLGYGSIGREIARRWTCGIGIRRQTDRTCCPPTRRFTNWTTCC